MLYGSHLLRTLWKRDSELLVSIIAFDNDIVALFLCLVKGFGVIPHGNSIYFF